MKLQYLALCIAMLTQSVINPVLHATDDDSTSEAEKFYARQNAIADGKQRHLLLKVAIPTAVTALIGYGLLRNYQNSAFTAFGSLVPEGAQPTLHTLGQVFYNGYQAACTVTPLQIAEVVTVLGKAGAHIKGMDYNIVLDCLRIINSLLFMYNKEQISADVFLAGGYYTAVWLLYDVYSLIHNIGLFGSDEPEAPEAFDKLGKALCTYVLPVLESAATLHLALNNGESEDAKKMRHQMQSLYSLIRALSLYLTVKRDAVDVLLVLHALATLYPILTDALFGLSSGNAASGHNQTTEASEPQTPQPPQQPPQHEAADAGAPAEQQPNNEQELQPPQETAESNISPQQESAVNNQSESAASHANPTQSSASEAQTQATQTHKPSVEAATQHQQTTASTTQQSQQAAQTTRQHRDAYFNAAAKTDKTLPKQFAPLLPQVASEPPLPESNQPPAFEFEVPASCILHNLNNEAPRSISLAFCYEPPQLVQRTTSDPAFIPTPGSFFAGRTAQQMPLQLYMPTGPEGNPPLAWQLPPLSSTINWDSMDMDHEKRIRFDLLRKISAQQRATGNYQNPSSAASETIPIQTDTQKKGAPVEPLSEQLLKQLEQARGLGLIPAPS